LNRKAITGWWWEVVCLIAFAVLTGVQLFERPIIGIADNGDFPKVLAPQKVCDADGGGDIFAFVHARYVIKPECYWDSRLPSSESIVVWILKSVAEATGRNSFSITGAGKLHLPLIMAAFAVLLWCLHEASVWRRFCVPLLAIVIFTDVAYTGYLNSFFMDAASLVFLLPTVAMAAAWIIRPRLWLAAGYGLAGALFGFSKTQHAVTALLLAGLATWFATRAFRQRRRDGYCWAVSAVVVAASATAVIAMTPSDYRAEPLYSLVFFRMLPHQANAGELLTDLDLPESDLQYIGTHAYNQGAPIMKGEWRLEFMNHLTYGRLGKFYLMHPQIVLGMIGGTLTHLVSEIRPVNMGNYEREAGFPPYTRTRHFAWWSDLRWWTLKVFPAHIVIFYLLMGAGSVVCCCRAGWAARWPLYPLVLVLAIGGVLEFLFPTLLDGTETERHMFLFHVITELLIVSAFAGLAGLRRSEAGAR
jgi:hypothetical protein